ncbi:ExeM/NucH family extracellular endonuclease [Brevibacterium album]|uniref:ExeM/NucH family extracellular endonuclease n=1 Tax=Brevibacterium album TaxID=417948 RepID=UPI000418ADE6|nr:ExeM/NucH family extracellular endonuclease [Brevibacterium album]
MRVPHRPVPLLAAAVTAALVGAPLLAPLTAEAASALAVSEQADPAEAAEISEIAYAGGDDTDFIEIAAAPGTDLSGWTVGSVSRGGTPQSAAHVVTLAEGTTVGESGALAVSVPITNSVNSGAAADGRYGASAFAVDAAGDLVDFDQVGGVAGGRGVTAGGGNLLPEAVQGAQAAPTGATSSRGESIQLIDGAWTSAEPTPDRLPGDPGQEEPEEPGETPDPGDILPIAEVQGTGDASPYTGQRVTTEGVVTAVWAEGGLNGFAIQTSGTGTDHELGGASSGLFVYSPQTAGTVSPGDSVIVTGEVSEYYGQTQITVDAAGLHEGAPAEAPVPFEGAFPEDADQRESLESMLLLPTGDITVTDTYTTHTYGEVGLVNGAEPLMQATDVVAPGAEAQAYEEENQAREFVLDDGASADYTRGASDVPAPYVSTEEPVRVGAAAAFTDPVVVGYSREKWRLQPTEWLTGADAEAAPAGFADTREDAPQDVGGDLTVSSFNVLNYFPTTGDQLDGCTFYEDREGNPITVRGGCDARGAANRESFERQESKIVDAINGLDASVLSLEEIERSSAFGKDRDEALAALVEALNAEAGAGTWDFIPSPEALPEDEDVIRTAFIYQPAEVRPVGESAILTDSPAFSNAREPLAQAWAPASAGSAGAAPASAGEDSADGTFLAVVNHFKSKGSGSGEGNVDNGDGQGSSNADRVRQAEALAEFADAQASAAGTEDVVLLGDFNSYTEEDPMRALYDAGYTNVGRAHTDEQTYLYGGRVGSLDHVLVSPSLSADVTGADVWNINSVESIGLEYSRYNSNIADLYAEGPFRSSDHDPLLVGLKREAAGQPSEEPSQDPSEDPTGEPTEDPTGTPTGDPSGEPTQRPDDPSADPGDDGDDERPGSGNGDDGAGPDGTGDGADDGGSGDSRTDAGGDGKDRLPRTGSGLGALAAGAVLLGLGTATVVLARRRMG